MSIQSQDSNSIKLSKQNRAVLKSHSVISNQVKYVLCLYKAQVSGSVYRTFGYLVLEDAIFTFSLE